MDNQNLNIAWLLSAGGTNVRSSTKLLNARNIDAFNIPDTCFLIEERASTVPLQVSSGLLYGTVLVYKRKCDLGFKETQSVKLSIQKIKEILVSKGKRKRNKSSLLPKDNKVTYLADDPEFNVDFLGAQNGDIDLETLLKDLETNKSSAMGLGLGDTTNWKGDHGLREMSVSTENSDIYNVDYVDFDQRKNQNEKAHAIWDEDLDFGFDVNGDMIDDKGNKLLSQNKDEPPGFEVTPLNFEVDDLQFNDFGSDEDSEKIDLSKTDKNVSNKRMDKPKSAKRRKVIYDNEIYLSFDFMRGNRDQFIHNGLMKRVEWRSKIKSNFSLNLNPRLLFRDIRLEYCTSTASKRLSGNKGVDDALSNDNVVDLAARRRSSSASSIEQARRANTMGGKRRNSSSFQFDFNLETSQNDIAIDMSADMGHLEISFDEHTSIMDLSANMDNFLDSLKSKFNQFGTKKLEFETIYPLGNTGKREAAYFFHMLLHCATKNKIQLGLGSLAIGKSQWDPVLGSDIIIRLK